MNDKPYRPALTEEDMEDIEVALRHESEARIKSATKGNDAQQALRALQYRERTQTLGKRFYDMRMDRIRKAIAEAEVDEAQVTLDQAIENAEAEFDRRKAQAEAEEEEAVSA